MLTMEDHWRDVMRRDAAADGAFVYAVTTTGIYCRPSCASRRPKRENVEFFELAEAAEAAGFRACKRCTPEQAASANPALRRVREACRVIDRWLEDGEDGRITLGALAQAVGGSPHHLQRTFKRLMGVSPAAYAEARRLRLLKRGLRRGESVTEAMYGAGYGAPSRLYEKSAAQLGMTPASFGKGGSGAEIAFALKQCSLGRLLVAATERGVCFLALGDDDGALEAECRHEFPKAALRRDDDVLAQWVDVVVDYLAGATPHPALPLDVQATAFQRRVWEELMRIPPGLTRTYSQVAERLTGKASARRAVARACATNPVSLIIPCHRVKRGDGGLGGYRWGLARKQALIAHERDRAQA